MENIEKKYNILIANDDGYEATGIQRLAQALSQVANVYVAAPHIQRSAAGHGLTMGGRVVSLTEIELPYAQKAFKVTGTPADCVKMGLEYLEKELEIPIHVVFSGINHGSNLGNDTLYSGTVSAALEGALNGKPSVAMSVATHYPVHFDYACILAVEVFQKMMANPLTTPAERKKRVPKAFVLNVNVPDCPQQEVKGVCVTRLGYRGYQHFLEKVEGEGTVNYIYHGEPEVYASENLGIDIIAHQQNYATVTPLFYDLTADELLSSLSTWW